MIDLHFPVLGRDLPSDHGYALYGALSRLLPRLHEADCSVRIASIRGMPMGKGLLQLGPSSALRFRLPAESIPLLLPLAGKSLDVDGHALRVGVPQVRALIPAPALLAHLVTMKKSDRQTPDGTRAYMDPAPFLDAVRRELQKRGIQGQADLPLVPTGPHEGKPRRHVLRIKARRVVGFSVQVTELTAEESVRLQEEGLGGRGRMGCGFFVELRG